MLISDYILKTIAAARKPVDELSAFRAFAPVLAPWALSDCLADLVDKGALQLHNGVYTVPE